MQDFIDYIFGKPKYKYELIIRIVILFILTIAFVTITIAGIIILALPIIILFFILSTLAILKLVFDIKFLRSWDEEQIKLERKKERKKFFRICLFFIICSFIFVLLFSFFSNN